MNSIPSTAKVGQPRVGTVPRVSEPPKSPPKNIQKKDIQAYLQLTDEARQLEQAARNKRKIADLLAKDIKAWIRAHAAGKSLVVQRSGYQLAIEFAAGRVKWQEAYVSIAGEEAAQKLRAEAPPVEKLKVQAA